MTKNLYIIRGGAASGKTSITPLLAKELPSPVALLEQDNWRWGIHLVGRETRDVEKSEHAFADSLFMETLKSYLEHGKYTILVEGSFGWHPTEISTLSVHEITMLAKKYNYHTTSIVLKADIITQQNRNSTRKYTVPKDEFQEIYRAVYSYHDPSEIVIDSSGQNKEETLMTILEKISPAP